ncbi:Protein CBG05404 [Caenorhabditis briggsae]|uniref:Protein CBG05404 n=1 Tax=Caenorhabditis briggsae TaxID=6238 RepID=A8WZS9_CAEBR|nr:Protein CBG05404 [Caenorhabditis briggsae]CAP25889.1 Protein CBG05404 [Caenorhabditis briggsae]
MSPVAFFVFLYILITPILTINSTSNSSFFPTREDEEEIFRLMFEAQDLYRQNNYRKSIRDFNIDWENCDEKYRWPACCLWSEKKMFQRTTSDCAYIKGDVILEKNDDALIFQSLLDLREIQGSLVLRNTTFLEFGLPSLQKLGFAGYTMNGKRQDAALIIENNPYLMHLRLRRVSQIVKHEDQKYAIIRGNPRIKIDEKQYEILKVASNGSTDFDQFEFPQEIYVRHLLYELWPYCLFGFMIIVVFTHHFIMLEVNESRVKKKEQEMIDCLVKMRDATLAAELLIQTPMDVTLAFDTDVLHLCTDQTELIKKIEKLLDQEMADFKDESLEEVTAKSPK